MRAAVLLLALGGCDQLFNLDHLPPGDPQSEVDAALGVIVDAPSSCPSGSAYGKYGPGGSGLLALCVPANIPALLDVPSAIDTSVASQCDTIVIIDSYGTEACVKWATDIRAASVQATGSRALALVATSSITVTGLIDVSSSHTGTRGAGGNWAGCQPNNGVDSTTVTSGGGSGGAGGSFSTRGGNGGTNGTGGFTGSRSIAAIDRIRGGCAGGNGGAGPSSAGGDGGKSGGAVYFIGGASLQFASTAIVNASGAGGKGGVGAPSNTGYVGGGGGGAGGGSGGMIGLDSPLISIASETKLFANGGGGGGGGASTGNGFPGLEPSSDTIMTGPAGGSGAVTYGGKGGAGAAGTSNGAYGGTSKSGGGGGGGLGYIVAYTTGVVTSGKFSPPLLLQ